MADVGCWMFRARSSILTSCSFWLLTLGPPLLSLQFLIIVTLVSEVMFAKPRAVRRILSFALATFCVNREAMGKVIGWQGVTRSGSFDA